MIGWVCIGMPELCGHWCPVQTRPCLPQRRSPAWWLAATSLGGWVSAARPVGRWLLPVPLLGRCLPPSAAPRSSSYVRLRCPAQVEYVLSDKTGTLTQNVMGFVWASIDRQLYGKTRAANEGVRSVRGTGPCWAASERVSESPPLHSPASSFVPAFLRRSVGSFETPDKPLTCLLWNDALF
jgi:hypothetical protein